MFGKVLVLGIFVLVFTNGCARPKYIQESAVQSQPQGKLEADADCATTFTQSGFCLSWYWENKPTATQPGQLIFKVYRLNEFDKTPVEVDFKTTPEVILWMSGMGHGSTPTQTTRLDVGTYRTSNVFFIMPGKWDIRFTVKEENETTTTIDGAHVAINI